MGNGTQLPEALWTVEAAHPPWPGELETCRDALEQKEEHESLMQRLGFL